MHIINRSSFELAFHDRGKVHELQNRISHLFNYTLSGEMERLFDTYAPPDRHIVIETLPIDIGAIAYEDLDELPARVINALKDWLNDYLRHSAAEDTEDNNPPPVNTKQLYLDIMRFFLLSGTLPWYAPSDIGPLENVMLLLLSENATEVKMLIEDIGRLEHVRARLIYQFSGQIITLIVGILEPAEAKYIISYHRNTVRLQEETEMVNTGLKEFSRSVWYFILTYILVESGSYFNRKAFAKSTIMQMALHYNLRYEDILSILYDAIIPAQPLLRVDTSLLNIISELKKESEQGIQQRELAVTQTDDNIAENSLSLLEKSEIISYYLQQGSLPWWSSFLSAEQLNAYFSLLAHTIPSHLKDIILSVGKKDASRHVMIRTLEEANIINTIKLVEPGNAEIILEYAEKVQVMQEEKNVVVTEQTVFRQQIWKYILDFLLMEKGSTFNARMFVKYNLTRLAHHFNLDFEVVLDLFYESISDSSIIISDVGSFLFSLIRDLRKEYMAEQTEDMEQDEIEEIKAADNLIDEKLPPPENLVTNKDSFIHWLIHGATPSWILPYREEQPGSVAAISDEEEISRLLPWWNDSYSFQQQYELLLNYLSKRYAPAAKKFKLIAQSKLAAIKARGRRQRVLKDINIHDNSQLFPAHKVPFLNATEAAAIKEWKQFNNALKHWLAYGVFPAWAYMDNAAPSTLIAGITAKSPDEALQILKFAGLAETSQRRFIGQLPQESVTPIFRLLPYGNNALRVYDRIIGILQAELKITNAVLGVIKSELLLTLWNTYIGSNYNFFDEDAFIKESTKQLPFILKISPQSLRLLFSEKGLIKQADEPGELSIYTVIDQYMKAARATPDISALYDNVSGSSQSITGAEEILRYILLNGKLPEAIKQYSATEEQYLIRELLLLLYREKKNVIAGLMEHAGYKAGNKLKLLNALSTQAGYREREARLYFRKYIAQELAGQFREAMENNADATSKLLADIINDGDFSNREEFTLFLKKIIAGSDKAFVRNFIESAVKSEMLSGFLAEEMEHDQVYSLMQATGIGWGNDTIPFIKDVQQLFSRTVADIVTRDRLHVLLREFNLGYISGKYFITNAATYIRRLFQFLYERSETIGTSVFIILMEAGIVHFEKAPAILHELKEIRKTIPAYSAVMPFAPGNVPLDKRAGVLPVKSADETSLPQLRKIKEALAREKEKQRKTMAEELPSQLEKENAPVFIDNIHVDNAGLVLLHPFFSTYFQRLNMLENGNFINDAARLRGAHLLQYIVFGTDGHPEHKMALNKLLLDIPFETPLPDDVVLTEHEKEVSVQLLNAVLHNWDKVKNVSVDGFRGSFLQREGALFKEKEEWTLRVEQRGYDVLLQTLPWGIGMIKASWMHQFLYVQWI